MGERPPRSRRGESTSNKTSSFQLKRATLPKWLPKCWIRSCVSMGLGAAALPLALSAFGVFAALGWRRSRAG